MSQAAGHHVKTSYRKYLLAFEEYRSSFAKVGRKARQRKAKKDTAAPKTKEKKLIKAHSVSGRASPSSRSDDDIESGARRSSRRRKISESVAGDEPEVTPPKATKRTRRSKNDADSKSDSDLDDASSTASSERSSARCRSTPSNDSQKNAAKERQRSNSGAGVKRKSGAVYKPGDRIRVKYGKDSYKLYTAKVVDLDEDEGPEVQYYVHYAGWNSRHDEWIKAWQIASCIDDNDSTTPSSSPVVRPTVKRPKTPVPADEKKPSSNSNATQSSDKTRESVKDASPTSGSLSSLSGKGGEDEGETNKSDSKKEPPSATTTSKKPSKGRTRRPSTSSTTSSQSTASASSKRNVSEESSVSEKSNPDSAVKQESKEAAKTEGRSTPTSILTSRRTSGRRSKSPAYLRESTLYGLTRRKRTSSITSSENSPACVAATGGNGPSADLDNNSSDSLRSSASESAAVSASGAQDRAEKVAKTGPAARRKSTDGKVEVKAEDKRLQEAYGDFDDEAPVIALEKPRQSSPTLPDKPNDFAKDLAHAVLSQPGGKPSNDALLSVMEDIRQSDSKSFVSDFPQLDSVVAIVSGQPTLSKPANDHNEPEQTESSDSSKTTEEKSQRQHNQPGPSHALASASPSAQVPQAPAVPPPVPEQAPTGSKVSDCRCSDGWTKCISNFLILCKVQSSWSRFVSFFPQSR